MRTLLVTARWFWCYLVGSGVIEEVMVRAIKMARHSKPDTLSGQNTLSLITRSHLYQAVSFSTSAVARAPL